MIKRLTLVIVLGPTSLRRCDVPIYRDYSRPDTTAKYTLEDNGSLSAPVLALNVSEDGICYRAEGEGQLKADITT